MLFLLFARPQFPPQLGDGRIIYLFWFDLISSLPSPAQQVQGGLQQDL